MSFGGSAQIRGWICAPMIVGDRVVGVLSVDKFEPDVYNEELAELATAFAAQAAIAIENARLLETERAAREQAETLRAAAHSLGSTLGVPEVFDLILSELRKVVPVPERQRPAARRQRAGDRRRLRLPGSRASWSGAATTSVEARTIPPAQLVEQHETLIVADVDGAVPELRGSLRARGRSRRGWPFPCWSETA